MPRENWPQPPPQLPLWRATRRFNGHGYPASFPALVIDSTCWLKDTHQSLHWLVIEFPNIGLILYLMWGEKKGQMYLSA